MPEPGLPDDPKPPSIADASSLFADDPPAKPAAAKPAAAKPSVFDTDEIRPIQVPASPPSKADAPGGYDLEIDPYPGADAAPAGPVTPPLPMTGQRPRSRPKAEPPPDDPIPEPRPAPRPRSAPAPSRSEPPARAQAREKAEPAESPNAPIDTGEFEAEVSGVDPVWTRGGEWGADLARVGMAAAGTLVLAWLVSGSFSLMSLALLVGGAATVLLSYPILITLERPVRITPEQAVTDFYAAASHHFPSYRRMWLLLSSAGRESGPFASFEAFRDHWKGRVDGWKARGGAGRFTPLKFAVVAFRADKSTGKETSKADYTVHVLIRGRVEDGPIASFKVAHGLVKGPDRMWYLNTGKLPASAIREPDRDGDRP